MEENLHIFRKIINSKVEIKIKKSRYNITYPQDVWNKFPKSLHKVFADSLAYVATWHLPLLNNTQLNYHFSHPLIEPTFFKILLYSIPINVFEYENTSTSELLKQFYNNNFKIKYKAIKDHYTGKKIKKSLKKSAIVLLSFGKESLLTFGLLEELDITPVPFFMKEPQNIYENNIKKKLTLKFSQEIKTDVNFFPLSIGKLRQSENLYWGWDIVLSQYVFILIPYLYYYQSKYLFIGNEQSCNFFTTDPEGYFVNPVFEQSVAAMQLIQDIPRLFLIDTHVGSIVEPIHEIFITYILHHRYPDLGKFHTSCFSETPQAKKNRWCLHCEKCARIYLFLKGLNINPERVGFKKNCTMLNRDKKRFYMVFDEVKKDGTSGGSAIYRDEELLAFYLAYKNGTKGELIDDFVTLYLVEAEKKKDKLIKEYFNLHSSYSLPPILRARVIKILNKEKESVNKYLEKLMSAGAN